MKNKFEVAVIGAGPIGLEMAVALKENDLSYIHFEARQVGNTICQWPEDTHFYSAPERVSIAEIPVQNSTQLPLTKESYLAYLRQVVEIYDLEIHTYEKVLEIEKQKGCFLIKTNKYRSGYEVEKIILATGDMSYPNKVSIPGSDQEHVHFEFQNVHQYFRKKVLVVGGRNSALEAALRCYRIGAQVSLSYRNSVFEKSITKPFLIAEIEMLIKKKMIEFLPHTELKEIGEKHAVLKTKSRDKKINIDFVLFRIGYVADLSLFEKAGVKLKGKDQKPSLNPDTMETNVPGIFVAGTIVGGNQSTYDLFIDTCHNHVEKIIQHLSGNQSPKTGSVPSRNYSFQLRDIQPKP